jgi:hypothetical protein
MSMLEVDSVVTAVVLQTGTTMLLQSGGHEIFVNVPEKFWHPRAHYEKAADVFPIGSKVQVYILGYMYPRSQFLGSIRRAYPESNPYRRLSRIEPGMVFRGRVLGAELGSKDLAVILDQEEIYGTIPRGNLIRAGKKGQFRRGDQLDVVIEQLDVNQEKLEFNFPNAAMIP